MFHVPQVDTYSNFARFAPEFRGTGYKPTYKAYTSYTNTVLYD